MERINDFTGGDPEQIKELTDLYVTQTAEQLKQLREALKERDVKKVEHLSHKGAGSSATCGMLRMAPMLRQIEHTAREGRLDGLDQAMDRVDEEFVVIQNFLAGLNLPPGS